MEENKTNEVEIKETTFNGGLNKKERNLVWIAIGLVLALVTYTLCEYAYNELFTKSSSKNDTKVVDDTVEPVNTEIRKISKFYQGENETGLTSRTEMLYLFDNDAFVLYDAFSEGSVQSFFGKYSIKDNNLVLKTMYEGGSGCGFTKAEGNKTLIIDDNGNVKSYIGEFTLSENKDLEEAENILSSQGGCTENIDEAKALYDLGIDVTYTAEDGTEYLYSGSKQTITKKDVNNVVPTQIYNTINTYVNENDENCKIEFMTDGTFKATENQCEGYSQLTGSYEIVGNKIIIYTDDLFNGRDEFEITETSDSQVTKITNTSSAVSGCANNNIFVVK